MAPFIYVGLNLYLPRTPRMVLVSLFFYKSIELYNLHLLPSSFSDPSLWYFSLERNYREERSKGRIHNSSFSKLPHIPKSKQYISALLPYFWFKRRTSNVLKINGIGHRTVMRKRHPSCIPFRQHIFTIMEKRRFLNNITTGNYTSKIIGIHHQ